MPDHEKVWTDIVHELAKRPVSDRDSSYKNSHENDQSAVDAAGETPAADHRERFNPLLGAAARRPKSSD